VAWGGQFLGNSNGCPVWYWLRGLYHMDQTMVVGSRGHPLWSGMGGEHYQVFAVVDCRWVWWQGYGKNWCPFVTVCNFSISNMHAAVDGTYGNGLDVSWVDLVCGNELGSHWFKFMLVVVLGFVEDVQ